MSFFFFSFFFGFFGFFFEDIIHRNQRYESGGLVLELLSSFPSGPPSCGPVKS